jgi:hypothetical protein
MRYQGQNPVYLPFKKLLAPTGRYPAQHVDIFWNRDDTTGKVKDVEVVFVPRQALDDEELQDEYARYSERWESDLGNSTADWLQAGGDTPEDIFGYLLHYGFASEGETQRALEEFAHIEECEWARLMLQGFKDE